MSVLSSFQTAFTCLVMGFVSIVLSFSVLTNMLNVKLIIILSRWLFHLSPVGTTAHGKIS